MMQVREVCCSNTEWPQIVNEQSVSDMFVTFKWHLCDISNLGQLSALLWHLGLHHNLPSVACLARCRRQSGLLDALGVPMKTIF